MHLIHRYALVAGGLACSAGVHAAGAIENPQPNSIQTGITAITGWNCSAHAITLRIDDGPPIVAPYGSLRADTAATCGGNINTGYAYLINYNTLSAGAHTLQALADGVPFATITFNTISLGGEFLSGKNGEYWLNNFPDYGKRSRVTWQQSTQNFTVTASDTNVPALDGTFYGSTLVNNSGCTNPQNNGAFLEAPDVFTITYGGASVLNVVARASQSTCTYAGTALYSTSGGDILVADGQFACSTGAQGTWTSDRMTFDAIGLLANLQLKYTVGETCTATARFAASR